MAGKVKSMYICSECGYQSPKWMGKCPGCGNWSTMQETVVNEPKSGTAKKSTHTVSKAPMRISEIKTGFEKRCKTGIGELDRVLGGGIVKGSLILVGGDPGIGKSTLLLQICEKTGRDNKILYISGEESESQIKLRAERLGVKTDNLYLISETDVETITETIKSTEPSPLI